VSPLRLLLVEDSPADEKLMVHELLRTHPRTEVHRVEDAAGMQAALFDGAWDAVISDWAMPTFSALAALALLQKSGLDIPFIIVSGTIGEEPAVEAMRAGAHDYVLKGKLARLAPVIEREIRDHRMRISHRAQEARFRALIERSTEAILVSEGGGAFAYASPAAELIFGRTEAEIRGARILDFVHPDDRSRVAEGIAKVRGETKEAQHLEFRIVRPDGHVLSVESTSRNLLDDPTILGIVTNLKDISERANAAQALRASEARFARLAESGIIGIVSANISGDIFDVNETFVKTAGYTRHELLAGTVNWHQLLAPERTEETSRKTAQLVAEGVAPPWETEGVAKDGTRVPMLMGVAMLDYPNCIAFTADLTEKKRAEKILRTTEDQLRQAQKMEAVGRLAGGIAHDFNNVLAVILSYSEFLSSDIEAGSPMRDDVEEIRKAAKRAANLTRHLLMFSRQQVLEPRILDLNEILRGMEKMLQRLVGEDVDVKFSTAVDLKKIKADPSSLEQVIMNLVINARDAMPTGGVLTIETADVDIDAVEEKHDGLPRVMLAVTDTGIGMDQATQAHIFEPFFTTKSHEKGTGLGLSTVFGIVEQSGGMVRVESALGKGTTFRIYLPCREGVNEVVRVSKGTTTARGSETILLVEDEEQVRVVARDILKRHGYHVIDARNAGEAFLLSEKHSGVIDLMLSDVVMPQMSGPELAQRLVLTRPKMKILYMSGYTDDSTVRHGVSNSDIAFLQKPFTPGSLAAKVRAVLDS
jgi:two-component system, cell cycle sensor histidine kinase and response regulator CckA